MPTPPESRHSGVGHWIVRARRWPWVGRIKNLIPQRWRRAAWEIALESPQYEILGSQMRIPPEARNKSLLLDQYEPVVTERIRAILREGMTFCDVGANIGVLTVFAARLVGSTGKVISFEPIPENARFLRTNLALNHCHNVLVLEKAVAEVHGRAEIHLSSLCGCHSMVSQPDAATGQSLSIETVRLDEIAELARMDLLKIDAEG